MKPGTAAPPLARTGRPAAEWSVTTASRRGQAVGWALAAGLRVRRSLMMSPDDLFDSTTLKALGHPLRLRLLEAIIEQGEASPVALARQLDQPVATVSRHVRLLRDLGFVELTRTVPRRGPVEHFYRAVRLAFIDDAEWSQLPLTLRRGLARQTFRTFFAEAAAAGAAGGFDRPHAHLDRLLLRLDSRGRQELSEALHGLMAQARQIQRRADERRTEGVEDAAAPMRLGLVLFELAEPPDRGGA